MNAAEVTALTDRRRIGLGILLGAVVLVVLVIKSFSDGWFEPKTPLELNGKPALVFFSISRGCECMLELEAAAEAQLVTWPVPESVGLQLLQVNFDRRPDLAKQYTVYRAPALVLLNSQGQVVWKQDEVISDEVPLDLMQAEEQISLLLSTKGP